MRVRRYCESQARWKWQVILDNCVMTELQNTKDMYSSLPQIKHTNRCQMERDIAVFLVVQYSWNSQSNPIIFISLADGCTARIFTVIKYTLLESMCTWMQTVGDRYYVILQDWISFFLFFEKPVTIHNSLQIHFLTNKYAMC